jgi:hypothetical protein
LLIAPRRGRTPPETGKGDLSGGGGSNRYSLIDGTVFWTAQDADGREGGLFVSREAAEKICPFGPAAGASFKPSQRRPNSGNEPI